MLHVPVVLVCDIIIGEAAVVNILSIPKQVQMACILGY